MPPAGAPEGGSEAGAGNGRVAHEAHEHSRREPRAERRAHVRNGTGLRGRVAATQRGAGKQRVHVRAVALVNLFTFIKFIRI